MLISRGQALWSLGRDDEALADGLAAERLAVTAGWTTAAAYLSHQVAWIDLEQGRLADAEERLHRALELTEDDEFGHVRAVALNGARRDAAEPGRVAGRGRPARRGAGDQRGDRRGDLGAGEPGQPGERATPARRGGHAPPNCSPTYSRPTARPTTCAASCPLWTNGASCTVSAATPPPRWTVAQQAHDMAVALRDRKATAQTAATVAQAHLALGDTTSRRPVVRGLPDRSPATPTRTSRHEPWPASPPPDCPQATRPRHATRRNRPPRSPAPAASASSKSRRWRHCRQRVSRA